MGNFITANQDLSYHAVSAKTLPFILLFAEEINRIETTEPAKTFTIVRFQVLTAASMKMIAF
jgi:hypothetical protein